MAKPPGRGRLLQKRHHRLKGIEREVQKNVLAPDGGKHVFAFFLGCSAAGTAGRKGLSLNSGRSTAERCFRRDKAIGRPTW